MSENCKNTVEQDDGDAILPSDVVSSLREGISKVLEIPESGINKFDEVRVQVNWIPAVEIVFTPRR